MKRIWLLVGVLAAGCNDEQTAVLCPVVGNNGPALTGSGPYLLVAGGLSETWSAFEVHGDTLTAVPGFGLTGQSPNDMDVVGDRLLVVNSGENNVSVIDLPTGRTVSCIETGTGTNPWELMVDPFDSNRAYGTTFLSGELLELDLGQGRVVRRVVSGPATEGLLVGDSWVAVTLTGFQSAGDYTNGTVVLFDKATLTETARLSVPPNAQFPLQGPDGRIHVVCSGNYRVGPGDVSGQVVRLESDRAAVRDTLTLGGSPARAVVAPGGIVYVASFFGGILAYDGTAFIATHTIANPLLPMSGFSGITLLGDRLAVANFDQDFLVLLRLSDHEAVGDVLTGDGPVGLATYRP